MRGPIREPAPAKLNPVLRVLGRRDDGYHDIETLVLPLTLADGVEAAPADGLFLTVAGPRAGGVPTGDENLVLRAARTLAEATSVEPRARLLLAKQVPVAAGLGGGSADAAAALRALNDLWGCGLDRDGLARVASEVGSDVPALVLGGPVLARGRGERVEPVEMPRTWWVLMTRDYEVEARTAYERWDADRHRSPGPDPSRVLAAFRRGDLEEAGRSMFNDLEGPMAGRSEVGEMKMALLDAGVLGAIMCGSGPTVAGLCRDGPHAEAVAEGLRGLVVASITRPRGG